MREFTTIQAFTKVALEFMPNLYPWPGLPKTGHPLKTADRDDGDLNRGFPLSGPRFTKFNDGTVFDNVTGRMWVANPGLCGPPISIDGIPQELSWDAAIDACNNLNYAGYTDWKLPNIKELKSLFYIMETGQHIDYNFFTVYNWYYWSSTTYKLVETAAWVTEWIYAWTITAFKETSALLVLPVRGMPKFV
jgi:hypothetical protein